MRPYRGRPCRCCLSRCTPVGQHHQLLRSAPQQRLPWQQGHGGGSRYSWQGGREHHLRWHRLQRLFLEVRPSNPHAIALYESEGFNEIGKRPNYYPAAKGREDGLVMAIELQEFDFGKP